MPNWYYFKNKRIEGPVDDNTLRELIGSGDITSATLMWSEKLDSWKKMRETSFFEGTASDEEQPIPESLVFSHPDSSEAAATESQKFPAPENRELLAAEKQESSAPEPSIIPENKELAAAKSQDAVTPGSMEPANRERPGFPEPENLGLPGQAAIGAPQQESRRSTGPERDSLPVPGESGPVGDQGDIAGAHPCPGEREGSMPPGDDPDQWGQGVTEVGQQRPWVRFFARMTDYLLWACIYSIGFYFFMMYADPSLHVYVLYRLDAFLILTYLITFLFFEALLLATLGTTVGKWLLGTSVRDFDGTKLSYGSALSRSFSVWVRGLCLGIPVINLITLLISYSNVRGEKGKTSWDRIGEYQVLHKKLNPFGVIAIILINISSAIVVTAAFIMAGIVAMSGILNDIMLEILNTIEAFAVQFMGR